jgi:hypothetical protein
MNINLNTLADNQYILKEKFPENESIAYANVSNTQLSVARHFGGCKVQGKHFVYNPTDDSLIREDVISFLSKQLKNKQKKKQNENIQDNLQFS